MTSEKGIYALWTWLITLLLPFGASGQRDCIADSLRSAIAATTYNDSSLASKVVRLEQYRSLVETCHIDSLVAYCDHRIALAYYNEGDFANAHPYYVAAYTARKSMRGLISYEKILRSGLYAGLTADYTGKPDSAKQLFSELIQGGYPKHRYIFRAYHRLADVYRKEGDYEQSRVHFDQAMLGFSTLTLGERFNLIGDYMILISEAKMAERYFSAVGQAESLLESVPRKYQTDSLILNISRFFNQLAALYDLLEDAQSKEVYLRMALNGTDNPELQAGYLNDLSRHYRRTGNLPLADSLIHASMRNFRGQGYTPGLAMTYDNLGEIYLLRQDYVRAGVCFDSSLALLLDVPFQQLTDDYLTLSQEKKIRLSIYLGDRARAYYLGYTVAQDTALLTQALRYFRFTDQVIDMIRQSFIYDESHFRWREEARDHYAGAIAAALQAGDKKLALEFLDRGKALVLTEALQRSRANRNIPDSLRMAGRHLMSDINRLELAQRKLHSNDSLSVEQQIATGDSLHLLREQFATLQKQIRNRYAGYFAPTRFDLTAIQQTLLPDQSILSYFEGTDTVLCAHVTHNSVVFRHLGSSDELNNLISITRELTIQAEAHSAIGHDMSEQQFTEFLSTYASTYHQLYNLLLAPWDALPRRVMIIADGQLHSLNFEMLLAAKPSLDQNLGQWPFALRDHAFSYNHSIMNWQEMSSQMPTRGRLVGVAPTFDTAFAPLTYSQSSLQQVRAYPKHLLTGTAANRGNIVYAGANAILSLETHAVISEAYSGTSFIVLNNKHGAMDSLMLKDIYYLNLPGTFAILTACETHVGDVARGEGVISLARAFTQAGASSMITSLWKVNDYASARIMGHFYQALSTGLPKDEALRQAKLTYLAQTAKESEEMPFYWAPLILIGDTSPILPERNYMIIVFGAFLALLVGWALWTSVNNQFPPKTPQV